MNMHSSASNRDGASPALPSSGSRITDAEFRQFQKMVKEIAGINLTDLKKHLVESRLAVRLRKLGLHSYAEYFRRIHQADQALELQTAIDLLTTNETSFFREKEHFTILREHLKTLRPLPTPFRVWSAASSSGEEAYTIAMVLAEVLGGGEWEVVGTDISTRVLEKARKGLYPMERAAAIPKALLNRYCLRGEGSYEGMFLIDRSLRSRVGFLQVNLIQPLPRDLPRFDVAFLRNVLIYFEPKEKKIVLENVASRVKPGGLLLLGHSESIHGLSDRVVSLRNTVYRVV